MMENKNIWIWILAVVALLFFFGSFGMSGYGMGMMGFGFIFMLIFWGIIIWIIAKLINTSQSNKNESDSLTILKRRYASGEITKKHYKKIKKEINQ